MLLFIKRLNLEGHSFFVERLLLRIFIAKSQEGTILLIVEESALIFMVKRGRASIKSHYVSLFRLGVPLDVTSKLL